MKSQIGDYSNNWHISCKGLKHLYKINSFLGKNILTKLHESERKSNFGNH